MAIYFIADTHFFHKDIIDICDRPFVNLHAMHEYLIRYWNYTISENDEVYICGDFAIGSKDEIADILSKLNGRKYLIMGNHDTLSIKDYYEIGFEKVYDKPVVLDNFWILSHEPLFMTPSMAYVNIFGHVHNNPIYSNYSTHHFCVCVERLNFRPILFDTIKSVIEEEHHNES